MQNCMMCLPLLCVFLSPFFFSKKWKVIISAKFIRLCLWQISCCLAPVPLLSGADFLQCHKPHVPLTSSWKGLILYSRYCTYTEIIRVIRFRKLNQKKPLSNSRIWRFIEIDKKNCFRDVSYTKSLTSWWLNDSCFLKAGPFRTSQKSDSQEVSSGSFQFPTCRQPQKSET